MNYVPQEQDIKEINDYLDGLMSPDERILFETRLEKDHDLSALFADYQDTFAADKIFKSAGIQDDARILCDTVIQNIAAHDHADTTSADAETAAAPQARSTNSADNTLGPIRKTPSFWLQTLKVAACLLFAATLYFAGQSISPWGGEPLLQAGEVYAMLEESGFVAPRTCSPEQFPTEMQEAVGVSLAFADDVPGVELLGWNYPDFIGTAVLSESEIILMAEVEGQGVAVVIDQAEHGRRLRTTSESGLSIHKIEIQDLVLYEISPFPQPKILPLLTPVKGQ